MVITNLGGGRVGGGINKREDKKDGYRISLSLITWDLLCLVHACRDVAHIS